MAGNGNGRRLAVLGAVLLALLSIFALFNGIPFDRRGAAAEVKADILRELVEIKADIREIRDTLREQRR